MVRTAVGKKKHFDNSLHPIAGAFLEKATTVMRQCMIMTAMAFHPPLAHGPRHHAAHHQCRPPQRWPRERIDGPASTGHHNRECSPRRCPRRQQKKNKAKESPAYAMHDLGHKTTNL